MTQRQKINDPNEQGAQTTAPGQLTVQDTFGVSKVAPNPNTAVLNSLAKFGERVGVEKLQKERKAAHVAGQQLRHGNKELTGNESAPTRAGYKALDAKLRAQQWFATQKAQVDVQDNDLSPEEYAAQSGARFEELLTGDEETDAILTASAGQYAGELGRYHASAHVKKRTADGITQATADVRNFLTAIVDSKRTGDPQGESAAREGLIGALTLPTVRNQSIRQQLAADLSILGLEMGEASVLNHAREQGVLFTPDQELKISSATAKYNAAEGRKLDIKYQNATGDFEAAAASAKSVDEYRQLASEYQGSWPNRATNKYMISQEASFRRQLAIGAKNKLLKREMQQGTIGKTGATPKIIQDTYEALKVDILTDPTLDPADADTALKNIWKGNGVVINSLKTEFTTGLAVPLKDGLVHPNFQPAFEKALEYYKDAPDLLLKHLPEEQQKLFLDTRAATTYGGLSLGDAVTALEAHKVSRKALTQDEREDFSEDISDAVDSVLGKGFFNVEHGLTTSLDNEPEVRTRLTQVANLALAQGMQDPEAAVEFARTQILKTHEQLGNALVFNDGTPISTRMSIDPNRVEDAMEYMYDQLTIQDPTINRDDTVLLGDPTSDQLLVGVKNEFGVISRVIPANLAVIGENFNADVIKPEHDANLAEANAALLNTEDKMALRQAAIETGAYSAGDADAALSNIIGTTVLRQRVKLHQEAQADQELAQRFGVESDDELADLKYMQAAFSPGVTLTAEQINAIQGGNIPARGIRNNNPGNIEKGAEWEGLREGTDSRFAEFSTPEHGIRAMAKTLRTYTRDHGLNTVAGIIERWAPAHENVTSAYINGVANDLGIDPNTELDVSERMPELIAAIIKHENGDQPYSDEVIQKGIQMSN